MASRFWVGGTANWDGTTTTHWASTSGGGGGASVPTSADDVTFDTASNGTSYTVTITATANCANLTIGNPATGTITFATSNSTLNIYGSSSFASGISVTSSSGTNTVWFLSTATGKTITTNGIAFPGQVRFSGVGGGWTFQDNITITNALLHYEGTLDFNNNNVTVDTFSANSGSTHETKLGSGTFTISGLSFAGDPGAGWTITPSTSTIKFTNNSASNKSFFGRANKVYNNVWVATSGTGWFVFNFGPTTINNLKIDAGRTVKFTSAMTVTVTTMTATGTAGNEIVIDTNGATTTHNLVKAGGGTIGCDYMNIQHSVATPANTWYAGTHSTNNQAVATAGSGWIFTDPVVTTPTGAAFLFSMI